MCILEMWSHQEIDLHHMLSKLWPTLFLNLLFESKYFWRYIVVHFQHPPILSLHTTIMLMHPCMLCVYFNLEWQSWNSLSHCYHEIAKLTSCFTNGDVILFWILFVFGSITDFTYVQCFNTYVHQAYFTWSNRLYN